MKQITLLLIAALSIFLFACEGPEGPAGADGQDGNANVKTEIFKVYPNDWEYDAGFYFAYFETKLITQDIVESGLVHAYMNMDADTWLSLPYYSTAFMYDNQRIIFVTEAPSVTDYHEFKMIVIESNLVDAKSIPVDFTDYNEVEEYFKLVD